MMKSNKEVFQAILKGVQRRLRHFKEITVREGHSVRMDRTIIIDMRTKTDDGRPIAFGGQEVVSSTEIEANGIIADWQEHKARCIAEGFVLAIVNS